MSGVCHEMPELQLLLILAAGWRLAVMLTFPALWLLSLMIILLFCDFIHYTSKLQANEQHDSFSFSSLICRFKAIIITLYDGNFWCRFLKLLQQQNIHTLVCVWNRLLAAISCEGLCRWHQKCYKSCWFLTLDWHKIDFSSLSSLS